MGGQPAPHRIHHQFYGWLLPLPRVTRLWPPPCLRQRFPHGEPGASAHSGETNFFPNAIPSLHVSTALLLALFAGRSRILHCIAWVYVAGTVAATLAFEHYVIDLIVAVPFACFAACAAAGKFRQASLLLAVVLAWMLSIRFAAPVLLASPVILRILACSTVAFAAFSMRQPAFRPTAESAGVSTAPACRLQQSSGNRT